MRNEKNPIRVRRPPRVNQSPSEIDLLLQKQKSKVFSAK